MHGLVDLAHLEVVGVRRAVRRDEAVEQEVDVARRPRRPVVAAVRPERAPVGGARREPLVHPVPDEAALQLGMRIDHVPVVLQVADAVAHRVRVFAHDERPVAPRLHVRQQPLDRRVHRRDEVRVRPLAGPLVHHRPRGVAPVDPGRGRHVVHAVARLVAQRPDDDRRVVLVALDHPHHPVEMRRLPGRVVAQRRVGMVAHPVRLDVRLVDDVEPVLVGQLVPARVVRVVARAHAVDVGLLHQRDVAPHGLQRHVPAGERIVLVAVHAPEAHGHVVHQQQPAAHLHPPEPHPPHDDLRRVAAGVEQREDQRVEPRRLRGPQRRRRHLGAERQRGLRARAQAQRGAQGRRDRRAPVGAQEPGAHAHRRGRRRPGVRQRHVEGQRAVTQRAVQRRARPEVAHVRGRHGVQEHVPLEAADLPVVLVLEVVAVREPEQLDRHGVLARAQVLRHVELGGRLAPFREPHVATVHPHPAGRLEAPEVQDDPPAAPGVRHGEGAAV